jgi:hypothetical protein
MLRAYFLAARFVLGHIRAVFAFVSATPAVLKKNIPGHGLWLRLAHSTVMLVNARSYAA